MEELPPGFLSLGLGPRRHAADLAFPFPSMRPPPALPDVLVEDILVRIPPQDSECLLRAALVCKRWARLLTDEAFHLRYVTRHGGTTTTMLGFFGNLVDTCGSDRCNSYRVHDARDGRVLLNRIAGTIARENEHQTAAALAVRSWNAAVLACCRRGPFRVAFAGIDANGLFAHVYSSESDAWGEAASAPLPVPGPGDAERLDEFLLPVPGAQVGYGLYFVLGKKGSAVLEYDPAARALAVIPLPELPYRALIALMALEGGGVLGFAEVDLQSTLRLWAAETDPPAAAAPPGQLWVVRRAIHLATQLPAHVSSVYYVVASADGAGVVFLCTTDGLYTFDLNSGQSTRVMSNRFYDIIPYVTFYTPGTDGVAFGN
ncbi:uncharacterized protein LOC120709799 [Panicum virgatum]|uniref:uncharacterized protein LOC120709799 n=1 Tax=Panicum virgatum TaxID=38727 RepID=UPI0019D5370B|nr:uncharacterized protein LOC120709799 [Panicum virgatum]